MTSKKMYIKMGRVLKKFIQNRFVSPTTGKLAEHFNRINVFM